jgi:hypothetical protein
MTLTPQHPIADRAEWRAAVRAVRTDKALLRAKRPADVDAARLQALSDRVLAFAAANPEHGDIGRETARLALAARLGGPAADRAAASVVRGLSAPRWLSAAQAERGEKTFYGLLRPAAVLVLLLAVGAASFAALPAPWGVCAAAGAAAIVLLAARATRPAARILMLNTRSGGFSQAHLRRFGPVTTLRAPASGGIASAAGLAALIRSRRRRWLRALLGAETVAATARWTPFVSALLIEDADVVVVEDSDSDDGSLALLPLLRPESVHARVVFVADEAHAQRALAWLAAHGFADRAESLVVYGRGGAPLKAAALRAAVVSAIRSAAAQ